MSAFCIHEHIRAGNYYEPPESWCDYEDEVEDCDHCPYRTTKAEVKAENVDHEYDYYRDSFDF